MEEDPDQAIHHGLVFVARQHQPRAFPGVHLRRDLSRQRAGGGGHPPPQPRVAPEYGHLRSQAPSRDHQGGQGGVLEQRPPCMDVVEESACRAQEDKRQTLEPFYSMVDELLGGVIGSGHGAEEGGHHGQLPLEGCHG